VAGPLAHILGGIVDSLRSFYRVRITFSSERWIGFRLESNMLAIMAMTVICPCFLTSAPKGQTAILTHDRGMALTWSSQPGYSSMLVEQKSRPGENPVNNAGPLDVFKSALSCLRDRHRDRLIQRKLQQRFTGHVDLFALGRHLDSSSAPAH